MKGITPVIAIILLLLITISMVGFAFIWFQRVAQTATSSTDTALQAQLTQQNQKVRIESAAGTILSLRNTGSQSITVGLISIFVNGTVTTSGNCPAATQAAGSIFSCTSTAQLCSAASIVKATAPGNSDQIIC